MAGVTTLIHLAATPDDVADPVKHLFGSNVVGVYHIFESARTAKVRRMIVASSGQVVWNQRTTGPLPIDANVQPTPRGWYAATKMFLEGAARAFADTHGIEVWPIRLGWCPLRTGEGAVGHALGTRHLSQPADAGRFFASAVEATTDVRFAIFYATSLPVKRTVYDLGPAQALLGYEPQDKWPQGVENELS